MSYDSPHGRPEGLPGRLAMWAERLGTDHSLPWVGLGLIRDLELAMRLLNVREFAEHLRANGTPEQQRFADDILANEFTLASVRTAVDTAGYRDEPDPVRAVEALDMENRRNEALGAAVRDVLVEKGALAPDDTATDIPGLIRVLLS